MALDNVLLAVGPGDADRVDALARATTNVAAPADATVTLAHVFTDDQYEETRQRLGVDQDAAVTPDDVARRHATVQDLADRLADAGVEHAVRGSVGLHGESIVSLTDDTDADLVLVGGRQRSPTGKAVFGSTAQTVLLSSPCPVTFVRGDH
ncbi:universal stress protein [Halobacterium zhouii]|uniref:universal stress protein n=1 Tax=Halobacterium zhouii TaxID=2902624 RepID=UPI001E5DACD9|nr:universal stress protein [Halobacterium zhouii]